ncbi:MAG: hypothetical protein ORN83_16465, partial [Chthoniobacteraceae bacterium]|nr:hypothetical protein [Chthoniobacteraceae bacterium]
MATSSRTPKKTTSRTKPLRKVAQPAEETEKAQTKVSRSVKPKKPQPAEQVEPLTPSEQKELAKLEATVERASSEVGKKESELTTASQTIAEALHQIQSKNLYRGKGTSFAEYSRKQFNYSLAHAKRLAAAGK